MVYSGEDEEQDEAEAEAIFLEAFVGAETEAFLDRNSHFL